MLLLIILFTYAAIGGTVWLAGVVFNIYAYGGLVAVILLFGTIPFPIIPFIGYNIWEKLTGRVR